MTTQPTTLWSTIWSMKDRLRYDAIQFRTLSRRCANSLMRTHRQENGNIKEDSSQSFTIKCMLISAEWFYSSNSTAIGQWIQFPFIKEMSYFWSVYKYALKRMQLMLQKKKNPKHETLSIIHNGIFFQVWNHKILLKGISKYYLILLKLVLCVQYPCVFVLKITCPAVIRIINLYKTFTGGQ